MGLKVKSDDSECELVCGYEKSCLGQEESMRRRVLDCLTECFGLDTAHRTPIIGQLSMS